MDESIYSKMDKQWQTKFNLINRFFSRIGIFIFFSPKKYNKIRKDKEEKKKKGIERIYGNDLKKTLSGEKSL
jgi:hypothetical protein